MHAIHPPQVNSENLLDNITRAKQQPRRFHLEAVREQVLTAYIEFEDAVPLVHSLVPIVLTNDQRDALHHAYSVETAPLTMLREQLSEPLMATRCPFCGVSEPGTLDHYLPKEAYPEFSVFALNLVPSCAMCNSRKRTLIVTRNTGIRMFLHPYFDEIPVQSFLTVQIELRPDNLLLSFSIRRTAGMSDACYSQLCSHFEQLDLADRYRKLSLLELRGRHHSFVRFYGQAGSAARVAEELQEEANGYEAAHGSNFWRVVLYRALAGHHEFCNGGFEVVAPR